MVLDIILIILLLFMILYGYFKGFIAIVAKLVSLVLAFVLAYILASTVGDYISDTNWGISVKTSIEENILEQLGSTEKTAVISMIQNKLTIENENSIIDKIINYVFTGIGFVTVFLVARIVLWIAQKILENIFELPVLKTFNKLGGVGMAVILYIIEISIILAVIKSVSSISFMSGAVNIIQASVITKALYDHNIFTSLILSKIF